jgi:hypothetical protein
MNASTSSLCWFGVGFLGVGVPFVVVGVSGARASAAALHVGAIVWDSHARVVNRHGA